MTYDEIREKVLAELNYCFNEGVFSTEPNYRWARETITEHALKAALSIPGIAIIDEDAELPMPYWAWCYQLQNGEITASQLAGYLKAAGWRKVIKGE